MTPLGLAQDLARLGLLCRNVQDANALIASTSEAAPLAQELAEWCTLATRLIGAVAIDVAKMGDPDRIKTAPEGVSVDEPEQEMCTFEDADCNRCILNAEHVGPCVFEGYRRQDVLIEGRR